MLMRARPVHVIVAVRIDRQHPGGGRSEQAQELRMPAHIGGQAGAADMAVQAIHAIGLRHNDIEIVGNQQHPAAVAVAQVHDHLVDIDRPRDIDVLRRLVEHQEFRLAQHGAREHHPLQLAAGQYVDVRTAHLDHAYVRQHGVDARCRCAVGQREEASHRQGQGGVHSQLLRLVADAQSRLAHHGPGIGLHQPQGYFHQAGFARAVLPDQGHDFAGADVEAHPIQDVSAVADQAHVPQSHERLCGVRRVMHGCGPCNADTRR